MGMDAVQKAGGEAPVRIDVLATSSAAPAAAPDAVPEAAPKRPRGRPPKARLDCALMPAVSKRPRGRPPGEGRLQVSASMEQVKPRPDTGSLRCKFFIQSGCCIAPGRACPSASWPYAAGTGKNQRAAAAAAAAQQSAQDLVRPK